MRCFQQKVEGLGNTAVSTPDLSSTGPDRQRQESGDSVFQDEGVEDVTPPPSQHPPSKSPEQAEQLPPQPAVPLARVESGSDLSDTVTESPLRPRRLNPTSASPRSSGVPRGKDTGVAGGRDPSASPVLLHVKKRTSLDRFQESTSASPPPQHRASGSGGAYAVTVVGGVAQKKASESSPSPPTHSMDGVELRKKKPRPSKMVTRRISCKDLGAGDCQGWLYMKRQGKEKKALTSKWIKRWVVLKNNSLFCYDSKSDLRAKIAIFMPAFQVAEVSQKKSSKHMFKVHNAGTSYFYASERREDMIKWLNKLSLSAIQFYDGSHVPSTTHTSPSHRSQGHDAASCSESEEEGEVRGEGLDMKRDVCQSLEDLDIASHHPDTILEEENDDGASVYGSRDELRELHKSICDAGLNPLGRLSIVHQRMSTVAQRMTMYVADPPSPLETDQEKYSRLQRQLELLTCKLKAKEVEVWECGEVLEHPEKLHAFLLVHPELSAP